MDKPTHKTENLDFSDNSAHVSIITRECIICHGVTVITVNFDKCYDWKNGSLIQNVWPNLTADQREIMINGTHSDCWDYMMGDGE